MRTYTSEDGLGSSYIEFIRQDSRGYIWFCTRDGLSQYDGYQFTTLGGEEGLHDPNVILMLEAANHDYWILTGDANLFRLRTELSEANARRVSSEKIPSVEAPNKFKQYNTWKDSSRLDITTMFRDRGGQLLVGTKGCLWQIHESVDSFTPPLALLKSSDGRDLVPRAIVQDHAGNLWIGTDWGIVCRRSDGRVNHWNVMPVDARDQVQKLLIDGDGRLWLGHEERGVIVLRPDLVLESTEPTRFPWQELKSLGSNAVSHRSLRLLDEERGVALLLTKDSGLPDNAITSLYQSSDSRIWIGSRKGLTEFDGDRLRTYGIDHGFNSEFISSVIEDRDRNLWVGTANGASRLALDGLTSYGMLDGLADLSIHSIHEDRSGNLIVVSGDWFIHRFQDNEYHPVQPRLHEGVKRIWMSQVAFVDRSGQLWVLTERGLYTFEIPERYSASSPPTPSRVYTVRNGLPSNSIFRLYEDRGGNIWIGTRLVGPEDAGLARWDRLSDTIHRFGDVENYPAGMAPSAFCEDSMGNLWIGFYSGGIARFRDGRFTFFSDSANLLPGSITALHVDHRGRIWFTTNRRGLSRIDEPGAQMPQIRTYTTTEGLSSNNGRCITEDEWGRIYVGSARGVDCLNPSTGQVWRFSKAEGLAGDFVTAAFRDSEGALWFGTFFGVSKLIPIPPGGKDEIPSIFIRGLVVAGQRIPIPIAGETMIAGLELRPHQNQLQVEFSAPSFRMGESLLYEFRLVGVDEDWRTLKAERTVHLAGLGSGSYTFSVRAVNQFGMASTSPAEISFHVLPRVWEQWWFIASTCLILGVGVVLIYRSRIRRLLELERVRSGIATDLHDDIGADLTQIAILSEVLKSKLRDGDERVMLDKMGRTARHIIDGMSDLVWYIDPRHDTVRELINRVHEVAGELLRAKEISFSAGSDPALDDIHLPPEFRKALLLVIKEGLLNAVRHAKCSSIRLTMVVVGRRLIVELSDDGQGMNGDPKRTGHGLTNMRNRIEGVGGALVIRSTPLEGTTVHIDLPLQLRTRNTTRISS